MRIPRVVVAGAASGVGKTTVTCAIIGALAAAGHAVRPFKVGPDYVDPMYLSAAAGAEARSLDAWLMGREGLLSSFVSHSGPGVSVIEGVMGYYDGAGGATDLASTYHVASITRSPVILVVDAARASRSVAATVLGFRRFRRGSGIAGVILNGLGSRRHEEMCRQALAGSGVPVVGAVHRDAAVSLESRHLGLVSTLDGAQLRRRVGRVAAAVSESLDVDGILRIARGAPDLPARRRPGTRRPRATIAVALDSSFNFYYHDNLDALRREGARLEFFSPVSGAGIPECDGMYIGGGFPEVLAGRLARNAPMRREVGRLAGAGLPVYAECGGLMYLTRSIESGGRRHAMAGVLDAETVMTGRMVLGYTRGRASRSIVSARARAFRGHEFHYSRLESVPPDARFAYRLEPGEGIAGGRDGMTVHGTLASYGHLYFDRAQAGSLVDSCARRSRR